MKSSAALFFVAALKNKNKEAVVDLMEVLKKASSTKKQDSGTKGSTNSLSGAFPLNPSLRVRFDLQGALIA